MNGMNHVFVPVDIINVENDGSDHNIFVTVPAKECPLASNITNYKLPLYFYPDSYLDKQICFQVNSKRAKTDCTYAKMLNCLCFHSCNQGFVTCNIQNADKYKIKG